MSELDKLRKMLTDAQIPYEDFCEPMTDEICNIADCVAIYGEAGKWFRNQVIYGRYGINSWAWDGIWQYGSYDAAKGMIESYGDIGTKDGKPNVVNAEEAFAIIQKHYTANNKDIGEVKE